ncbi:MAG TPA: phosphate ABC transporter permease PstA [Pirellulales bacterium]|jgi:phosphate transport system permease protein
MSSKLTLPDAPSSLPAPATSARPRRVRSGSTLLANGEPMIWLTGGALAVALAMIAGLLILVLGRGLSTFWPAPVVQLHTADGQVLMGEIASHEFYRPSEQSLAEMPADSAARIRAEIDKTDGLAARRLVRTGNYDLTATHFRWIDEALVTNETTPAWAVAVERLTWGRFYGTPQAVLVDGREVATSPEESWQSFHEFHPAVLQRHRERVALAKHELGAVNRHKNAGRLAVVAARVAHGKDSSQYRAAEEEQARSTEWEAAENQRITAQIAALDAENARYQMRFVTADGTEKILPLEQIVRAYTPNRASWSGKLGVYLSRWGEFLADDPREANSEGGVFPAIWGTVAMTLLMSIAVVPFGVLAALYLREYAHSGVMVSLLRIAINNLAGVPSIVFGVFGLGFFCYVVGVQVDQLLFSTSLAENTPTFGTGGIFWAALTLALLTLPVVIVTTEEALAAVPGSMREGSYACGASKWQTIWRIVLPRALPGIMTGMILAIARGAGEVAPLMLVGAMKSAPELPIDGVFPFVHPQRSFMHLGFHLYDLGFHSQNSEAARPMVFTTALLLIVIIAVLNITAVRLRNRLRKRFGVSHA